MAANRDDFPRRIAEVLAHRAGMRCSNPNCRQLTSGPQDDPSRHVNVGVAAHIAAAAKGGPRYDEHMSPADRASAENGIWLCQKCAALIDRDVFRYTVTLLHDWKRTAEDAARLEVEEGSAKHLSNRVADTERIRFFRQALDRPAFQDPFEQEGSLEDLDQALGDTVTALNTGALRARDGALLTTGEGKSFVENDRWREVLDNIVDLLRSLRHRLRLAEHSNGLHTGPVYHGRKMYYFSDRELAEWVDSTRVQILMLFNQICADAGVPELRIPPGMRGGW